MREAFRVLRSAPVPVRAVLDGTGWDERFVDGMQSAADDCVESSSAYVAAAFVGEQAVGFVVCELHTWNRLAQIQGLAVHVDSRRQGIAEHLVAMAEDFARVSGARGIYVDTPVDNQGGRRFYESLGYEEAYVMPQYYDAAIDAVTYQRFFG
jgi:ribosomal protein S18 acetylase RimI-like enzyme